MFQASVGNLPPGKEVLLKITYVTELTVAGNGLRFSIPTTVSPRYAPAVDQRGVGRPDSETLNPPVAWSVPYGLNLSVRLAMGGAITRIESPSHPVSVAMNGHAATVALSQRDAALDRDFVLSVECEGLDTPQAWIERDDNGGQAVAVAFVPRLGDAHDALRRDVPRRSLRLDGRHLDHRSAQRAAALPALDDPRLPLQHRRLRIHVRVSVPSEPPLRRGEPGRGERARRRLEGEPRRDRDPAGAAVRPGADAARRLAAPGRRLDRRRGHEHRRRARIGALACGARPRLHVRDRRRLEPASGQRARSRRRRVGGVHLPRRTNRTESRASVRATAVASTHRCPRLLGWARREAVAIGDPARVRRRAAAALRVRERGHDWRHPGDGPARGDVAVRPA